MSAVTRAVALAVTAAVTLPVTGCGTLSMLPGLGGDTTFQVEGTDGGDIDALAVQTITDAYAFLDGKLPGGATLPADVKLVSYDSTDPQGRKWCADQITDDEENAAFCHTDDERVIGWDRSLLKGLRDRGGDLGAALVLAHEVGHAANFAQAPDALLPVLVGEQRADCAAGAFANEYAPEGGTEGEASDEGDSSPMSKAMGALFSISDPLFVGGKPVAASEMDHGAGIERLFAFVTGYEKGATACFAIGAPDTAERRDRVPVAASDASSEKDMSWDAETLGAAVGTVNTALGIDTDHMALLTFDRCLPDGRPVSVCPNGYVSTRPEWLTKYQEVVKKATPLRVGDGTALAPLVNALANGWLRDRGANVRGDQAGLRAACVTGAVLQAMGAGTDERLTVTLSPGDLDEALAEVLVSGTLAADIDGNVPDDTEKRAAAYLAGIYNVPGPGACVTAFPDVDGEK